MMRTVFVVDDDVDGRCALGDLLEDGGCEVVLFPGPREALAALARTCPALVVTDLWTSTEADGALFDTLLAEARRSRASVIVFTAWSTRALAPRLDVPVVSKPNVGTLLPLIEASLDAGAREALGAAETLAATA
jgi:DNA-binding NtrC family response regulator